MRVALAVLMVTCGVMPAHAQNADLGNLWRQVTSGDRVQVKEASGHQTTGMFGKVSESALSVMVDGRVLEIPANDVREVRRRGDSVKNGFLIGAGVGAALGAAALYSCESTPAEPCLGPIPGALMGGAAYGAIGAVIDHFITGWTVAFRSKGTSFAFHPSIVPSPRGVRASVVVTIPFVY
jgi:hypothetical protein